MAQSVEHGIVVRAVPGTILGQYILFAQNLGTSVSCARIR